MGPLGRSIAAGLALAMLLRAAPACSAGQDLHAQSAAALLEREFPNPDLSYLLLDGEGRVIAQRWEKAEQETAAGSLMKPFLAAAYGRTHGSFPVFRCAGRNTCWFRRGHGALDLRDAIAFSCNSYFHQLLERGGRELRTSLADMNLGPHGGSAETVSLTSASPLRLARAYLELAGQGNDPAVAPVLEGMALSAQKGTAKAVSARLGAVSALAKTGTAPCAHARKAPGDGWALLMVPAEHPRAALLVRLHGRPGTMAAEAAAKMMAKLESIEAGR